MLSQINPNEAYAETPFSIVAVEPKKTFLEKVFLLHEEFGKPDRTKVRSQRMSRHLYDLGSMVGTEVEVQALSDHSLYENLIKHRESYSRISWVNYKSLSHTTVTFVPPTDVIELYRSDYQAMQEQMIYGESVPFDQLIESLTLLQDKFRVKLDLPPAS